MATGFASGGYITAQDPVSFTVTGSKEANVVYLDAYEGDDKQKAARRVLDDVLNNRDFSKKAYTQLDFNEAIAYILSELVNKEEK